MILFFVFSAFLFSSAQSIPPLQYAPYLWQVNDQVANPESVYYDPESKMLFVSNISGEGTTKDGIGYIQKLSPSGKMIRSHWVKGLNAPKGMRSHLGKLWVTDIDVVLTIDIQSGKILQRIEIPKAQFLNDIAIDSDGSVYVTDTIARVIYKINGKNFEVFLEGDITESPNGLLIKNGKLIVAAWGLAEKDWSAKAPGNLYSLDLKTKEKTLITKKPLGNLDGLEISKDGNYIVSDWMKGIIYLVSPKGAVQELPMKPEQGTADIGYIEKTNTLIIPAMKQSAVTAYDLGKVLVHKQKLEKN